MISKGLGGGIWSGMDVGELNRQFQFANIQEKNSEANKTRGADLSITILA